MSATIVANNSALTDRSEGASLKAQMKKAVAELKRLSAAVDKTIDDCGYIGVVDIRGKCWTTDALLALDNMLNFIVGAEVEPCLARSHIPLPLSPGSEGIKALIEYRRGAKETMIEAMTYWATDQDTDLHVCLDEREKNTIKAKARHVIAFIQAIEFKHHI
jgi:hypothetical protein